jgi:energy-coupling factor transporter transmembrane protein EcfT
VGADAMALHSYDRDMKTTSPKARPILIDRVQALVLAFFLMAWISLVAIDARNYGHPPGSASY